MSAMCDKGRRKQKHERGEQRTLDAHTHEHRPRSFAAVQNVLVCSYVYVYVCVCVCFVLCCVVWLCVVECGVCAGILWARAVCLIVRSSFPSSLQKDFLLRLGSHNFNLERKRERERGREGGERDAPSKEGKGLVCVSGTTHKHTHFSPTDEIQYLKRKKNSRPHRKKKWTLCFSNGQCRGQPQCTRHTSQIADRRCREYTHTHTHTHTQRNTFMQHTSRLYHLGSRTCWLFPFFFFFSAPSFWPKSKKPAKKSRPRSRMKRRSFSGVYTVYPKMMMQPREKAHFDLLLCSALYKFVAQYNACVTHRRKKKIVAMILKFLPEGLHFLVDQHTVHKRMLFRSFVLIRISILKLFFCRVAECVHWHSLCRTAQCSQIYF